MNFKYVVLLIMISNLANAQRPLYSFVDDTSRTKLIEELKSSYCNIGIIGRDDKRYNALQSSTQVLRFYPHVKIKCSGFTFKDNIYNYLDFSEDCFQFAYNEQHGRVDSLLGYIIPCYEEGGFSLEREAFVLGISSSYFKSIIPVLNKVNFKNATIFMIPLFTREGYVYILIENEVYVINNDTIHPFNKFFKERCKISKFRKMLEGG